MKDSEWRQLRGLLRGPAFALVGLTTLLGATIAIAYVHLGAFNLVAALAIAALKVGIIGWIFMELPNAAGIQKLAAGMGLFWLSFLFLLGFADYLSR